MGSYTFSWAHPANEVFVTGDFDDWKQTIKLEKEDGVFKKTVELPTGKHQYKFVVDGTWLTNDSHPKEEVQGKGIYNNVLHPHDLQPISQSSAAPESSTAALAGAVPKEERSPSDSLPGAFPLTPPAVTPGQEPQTFSVNPLPATEGLGNPIKLAAGEKVPEPSTFTSNTVSSTVKHDETPEVESFGVAPIPATAGPGNPIHLAPGEKVPDPSTFTSNTISSTVKTDAASYDKSDALPPQLGPVVVTPEVERQAKGGMFALPPLTGSLIPESSLPKDADTEIEKDPGFTIQSAAPTSTTAALAGQVPLEPRVPSAVTESQKEAHTPAEASANTIAVADKADVEEELKTKVPEQPATSESLAAAQNVPESVVESQKDVKASAEASANPIAVEEKKNVEEELKARVPEQPATSESFAAAQNVPHSVADSQQAVNASAEAASNPEAVEEKREFEQELKQKVPKLPPTVADVPYEVIKSQRDAHVPPEASANPEAVEEKQAVEEELLKKIPEQPAAADNTYATQAKKTATSVAGTVASGATVAASALAAAVYTAKDKAAETVTAATNYPIREKAGETIAVTQEKAAEAVGLAKDKAADTLGSNGQATAAAEQVPDVVVESQKEAHASPEAATNAEAVLEKKAVENELLREVKPTNEAGEPAPTVTAVTMETAPGLPAKADSRAGVTGTVAAGATAAASAFAAATYSAKEKANETVASAANYPVKEKAAETVGINTQETQDTQATAVDAVPEIVAESQKEAHVSPEAAADAQAVQDKHHLEKELLQEVWTTEEPGTPAPAITADLAKPAMNSSIVESEPVLPSQAPDALNASATMPAEPLTFEPVNDSRDVSPMSKQPTTASQTQPIVTTGVESGVTEAKTQATEPPATTTQTQPMVTTGVETAATEAKTEAKADAKTEAKAGDKTTAEAETAIAAQTHATSTTGAESSAAEIKAAPETPKKEAAGPSSANNTPERSDSNAAASDKKKKRHSFFGKLKDKFKSL
jgi:hypothetical protein